MKKVLSCLLILAMLLTFALTAAIPAAAEGNVDETLTAYPDVRPWSWTATDQNTNWGTLNYHTFYVEGDYRSAFGAVWNPKENELCIYFRMNPGVAFSKMNLTVGGKEIVAGGNVRTDSISNYTTRVFLPLSEAGLKLENGVITTDLTLSLPYSKTGATYTFQGKLIFSEADFFGAVIPMNFSKMAKANDLRYYYSNNSVNIAALASQNPKQIDLDITVKTLTEATVDTIAATSMTGTQTNATSIRFCLLGSKPDNSTNAGIVVAIYNITGKGLVLGYNSAGKVKLIELGVAPDTTNGTRIAAHIDWTPNGVDITQDVAVLTWSVNGGAETAVILVDPVRQCTLTGSKGYVLHDILKAAATDVADYYVNRLVVSCQSADAASEKHAILLTCVAPDYAPTDMAWQENADGTSVRFVSKVKAEDIANLTAVGYQIKATTETVTDTQTRLRTTTQVWSSIITDGETITAPDGYFFVIMKVTGINPAVTTTFTVSSYAKDSEGTEYFGTEATATVVKKN